MGATPMALRVAVAGGVPPRPPRPLGASFHYVLLAPGALGHVVIVIVFIGV